MFRKPSFLERLTGTVPADDFEDDIETQAAADPEAGAESWQEAAPEEEQEGELPVDMYHTNESIVIKTLVAGVNPSDLDIAITRDMVTIKGRRDEDREAPNEDYFHKELYWGSFSRTLLLPEEVIIDESEAKEKNGMLTIILPKLDRNRSAKLKVKTN